jgi:hypothetical protein
MKWTCKDGIEIDIIEMETSHIENTIRFLRRKGAVTERECSEYFACLAYAYPVNTPDGSAMAAENEALSFNEKAMFVSVDLQYLIDELSERKSLKNGENI